jgi:hypothetical protein
MPVDPAKDVAPVEWIACTNGMAGCREMKPLDACNRWLGGWNDASRTASGDAKWLRFERWRGDASFEDVVIDVGTSTVSTSSTVTAFRFDLQKDCSFLAALGPSTIAAVRGDSIPGYASGPPEAWTQQGTAIPFAPLPDFGAELSLASALATSDSTIALAYGFTIRAAIGSQTFSDPRKSEVRATRPIVIGDDVFVTGNTMTERWEQAYRLDPDGTHVLFHGRANTFIEGLATDGTTWFWVEQFGGADDSFEQPSLEVWSAPYTSDPAVLEATAKRVAALPAGMYHVVYKGVAFSGLYAFASDSGAAYVIRGADGKMQKLVPGPARSFQYPLLVTPTELWALESTGPGRDNTLTRLTLAW